MSDDSLIEQPDPLSRSGPPESMKRTLAAGAGWMAGLQLASKVIEVGFIAVLARLLAPSDFGVIAGATIFIQFTAMLVEIGIGATIVQLPDLDRNDIRVAGTLVFVSAIGYFLLAQVLAPLAGGFMKSPDVTAVIRVLSIVFLIQATGIVSENLLVRRLEVRRVMVAQLASRVIGTGMIGIGFAVAGFGYWSLVIATIAEVGVKALWVIVIVRPPVRPLFDRTITRRLLRRSSGFSTAKIINFVALRADNAMVGRTMDAAALGFYSRAYNLMSVPADLYGRIAERLIFPAMAKVQNDAPRLRRAFLRGLDLTATIGLSISALLALLAPEVVFIVLGDRWAPVIAPFTVLSTATYFRLGAKISGSLQRAKGATGAMIVNQIVYAVMVVGGCLIAYPYGIDAVAAAVSLGVFVFYCIVNYNACRLAGVDFGTFLWLHGHGALLALVVTLVAAPVAFLLRAQGMGHLMVLAGTGVAVGLLGMLLIWWRPAWLIGTFCVELANDVLGSGRRRLGLRSR